MGFRVANQVACVTVALESSAFLDFKLYMFDLQSTTQVFKLK